MCLSGRGVLVGCFVGLGGLGVSLFCGGVLKIVFWVLGVLWFTISAVGGVGGWVTYLLRCSGV